MRLPILLIALVSTSMHCAGRSVPRSGDLVRITTDEDGQQILEGTLAWIRNDTLAVRTDGGLRHVASNAVGQLELLTSGNHAARGALVGVGVGGLVAVSVAMSAESAGPGGGAVIPVVFLSLPAGWMVGATVGAFVRRDLWIVVDHRGGRLEVEPRIPEPPPVAEPPEPTRIRRGRRRR